MDDLDSRVRLAAFQFLAEQAVLHPDTLPYEVLQKAILAAGVQPGPLDVRALDELFLFGFILAPGILFRGIRRLPPGHWLLYEGGRTVVRPYWRLAEVLSRRPRHERLAEDWAEAVHAKLAETVALHARADVRIGAWLSGGLDSSAVTALARRTVGPLPSFTIGFETPAYDETRGQRLLAQIPGYELPNERVVCGVAGFRRYPEVLWHVETPSACTPDLPRFLLAETSARHVKVVLTGEGADEVFGRSSVWSGTGRSAWRARYFARGGVRLEGEAIVVAAVRSVGSPRTVAARPS